MGWNINFLLLIQYVIHVCRTQSECFSVVGPYGRGRERRDFLDSVGSSQLPHVCTAGQFSQIAMAAMGKVHRKSMIWLLTTVISRVSWWFHDYYISFGTILWAIGQPSCRGLHLYFEGFSAVWPHYQGSSFHSEACADFQRSQAGQCNVC